MRLALTAATAAVLASVIACTPGQGPAGRVVDKDRDWQPATKTYRYELTVETPDGKQAEFRVTNNHYDRCMRGSAYPACTRKDR